MCKYIVLNSNMSKKSAFNRVSSQGTGSSSVDDLDRAILSFLKGNGRAGNEEIGIAVGLSPSAVSRRIRSLERSGIISGYSAVVHPRALGEVIIVFVRIMLERQTAGGLQAFESALRRCDSVLSCYLMAGQYDYMLQVRVSNMADYERLHQKELSRLPGVQRIESSFALRDVRDSLQLKQSRGDR